jgi:hypothetical protein
MTRFRPETATHDPLAVTGAIALINALFLYPLWRWARRRVDESRAFLTLAVCAVSPFAVIFSRKIWTQDLLLPGVLALLWGVEWLRSGRPWLGITCRVGEVSTMPVPFDLYARRVASASSKSSATQSRACRRRACN